MVEVKEPFIAERAAGPRSPPSTYAGGGGGAERGVPPPRSLLKREPRRGKLGPIPPTEGSAPVSSRLGGGEGERGHTRRPAAPAAPLRLRPGGCSLRGRGFAGKQRAEGSAVPGERESRPAAGCRSGRSLRRAGEARGWPGFGEGPSPPRSDELRPTAKPAPSLPPGGSAWERARLPTRGATTAARPPSPTPAGPVRLPGPAVGGKGGVSTSPPSLPGRFRCRAARVLKI